jgi:hypothetical protein
MTYLLLKPAEKHNSWKPKRKKGSHQKRELLYLPQLIILPNEKLRIQEMVAHPEKHKSIL